MDAVTELKKKIKELEKHLSLRQIALQSGINYITLRNIKFGKSNRVTDSVKQRLTKFHSTFDPEKAKAKAAPKKRGPKKGSRSQKAASKGKKRGRKPGTTTKAAPTQDDNVLAAMDKEINELESRLNSLKKIRGDYSNMLG